MNVSYLYCLVKGPIQFLLHFFLQEAGGFRLFHPCSSGLEAAVVTCRIAFIDLRPQLLIHTNHNHTWQIRIYNIDKHAFTLMPHTRITITFLNMEFWYVENDLLLCLFLFGMQYYNVCIIFACLKCMDFILNFPKCYINNRRTQCNVLDLTFIWKKSFVIFLMSLPSLLINLMHPY